MSLSLSCYIVLTLFRSKSTWGTQAKTALDVFSMSPLDTRSSSCPNQLMCPDIDMFVLSSFLHTCDCEHHSLVCQPLPRLNKLHKRFVQARIVACELAKLASTSLASFWHAKLASTRRASGMPGLFTSWMPRAASHLRGLSSRDASCRRPAPRSRMSVRSPEGTSCRC